VNDTSLQGDPATAGDRALSFEFADAIYALPIAEVLEVAEPDRITCVPTLPRNAGGVMNWHGDAIPVVAPELLFEGARVPERSLAREHVLVLSDRSGAGGHLGLPIDRIFGISAGLTLRGSSNDLVVARQPLDGRVVNVLNPERLVARAREVIEAAVEAAVHPAS